MNKQALLLTSLFTLLLSLVIWANTSFVQPHWPQQWGGNGYH